MDEYENHKSFAQQIVILTDVAWQRTPKSMIVCMKVSEHMDLQQAIAIQEPKFHTSRGY